MLAKMYGHKIKYLHAYTPPVLDPNIPVGLIEETYAETIGHFEKKLNKMVEDDKSEGFESSFKISFSDLTSLIEESDVSNSIELIIVGKTGKSGFIDKLLGSTAAHLINHIHKPLLVIPENFNGDIFDQIAYASSLEFDEEKYIEKAIKWKNNSKNNIIIAHIIEKYGLDIFPNSQFVNSINNKFKKDGINIIERKSDEFKDGIKEFIKEFGVTLLVLTSHKRGFLDGLLNPSKTKSVVGGINIPSLIFSFEK
jgi:nucleotide-binding universal stress UspA family protein